ncbi:hypothetical protein Ciccas_003054 [Cichlidogyrus casuarinus]|uniref:Rab-GAP TBC domain-containing protein n=1 Tax=Cichlidogyrus casuarinus TaxID=1844966 RepID=A0ABD2QFI0_9PLAT
MNESQLVSVKSRIDKLVQRDKNVKSRKSQARCLCLAPESSLRKDLWLQILTTTKLLPPTPISTDLRELPSSFNGYELADRKLVPTYKLSENGIINLRQSLYQISIDRPELTYFPELWPMTAVLLHYLPTNAAVASVNSLMKYQYFLAQTKFEWLQRCLSIRFLIAESKFKDLCRMYSPECVKTAFLLWIIAVWNLPFTHLVCVIDCFLVEGWKVFYRAGLVVSLLLLTPSTCRLDHLSCAQHE